MAIRTSALEPHVVILGGGGTRGFLHAGFARAVVDSGLPIASYTGISIGAWAAAFMGMGISADELARIATEFDLSRIVCLKSFMSVLWKHGSGYRGYFDPDFVAREIRSVVGKATFADCKIPIQIQATDLATGEPFIFSPETTPDAPLDLAVSASCALVGVFHPITYAGRTLVDGTYAGYLLPESRPTIISNVSPIRGSDNLQRRSILNLLLRSYSLLPQVIIEEFKRKNPYVLEIQHDCRDVGVLSMGLTVERKHDLMTRSYGASLEALEGHIRMLAGRTALAA